MEDIFTRVRAVTARILRIDAGKIDLDSRFRADLGADSINLIEIAMAMEQELDITLDDDEVANIVTVRDAVRHIEKHI
ncbi:MAG: Acyl carrier protein [Firmicutes bacterium]|nr:Acyl carrier protein [Bacillota bacterium]